jgi:NADH-quinone oxidoreductase subunit G
MNAGVSVHEPAQPADEESPLAFTMEGAGGVDQPGALLPYVWAPGWNSNQSLQKFQSEIGGPLRGGAAGKRLLDDLKLNKPTGAAPPEERRPEAGELQLIARHRVFGSEELSARAPGISELCGQAWLELNSREAAARGLAAGEGVRVADTSLELRINDSLPDRCATFTAGFPSTLQLRSGSLLDLSKDPDWKRAPQVIGSDGGDRDG